MAEEILDTNDFSLQPTGHYILEVVKCVKKIITAKKTGNELTIYEWFFEIKETDANVERDRFKLGIFKSKMDNLIRALGYEEVGPGKFKFDNETVDGKYIECDLIHEPDNNGTLREALIEIKSHSTPEVPKMQQSEGPKAWDE